MISNTETGSEVFVQVIPDTLELVKYKAAHLQDILTHHSQRESAKFVKWEDCVSLERHEHSFSVLKNGKAIACIGLMKYWEGRYEGWAFMIPGNRESFLFIHNCVKHFLDKTDIRRVEMTVDMGFKQGHRWARLLGFQVECETLKSFGPTGENHRLYVKLREGN
jgi:hypothetical protein